MPYIGNTIRAADDYRLIDDISSGFNGNERTFALQVAGSAPVPFPKSPQQVLISVNGVIQEPDPTGSSGFNLVGTNIVFSSAPTNGHAFFGIIYATADYLNAGGNFPAGSLGAPSITFIGDENTGLFRKSGGSVGFVSDATEIANFDSNGITISSGNLIIPDSIIHNGDTNTKIRFPAADTVTVETSGSERLRIDASGDIGVGTANPTFNTFGSNTGGIEISDVGSSANALLVQSSSNEFFFANTSNANYIFGADSAPIIISSNGTEAIRIKTDQNVGIGTNNPSYRLSVQAATGNDITSEFKSTDANAWIQVRDNTTTDSGVMFGANGDNLLLRAGSNERMRIESNGDVAIGTSSAGGNRLKVQLSDDNADGFVVVGGSSQLRTNINLDAPNTNSTGFTAFKLRNSSGSTVAAMQIQNSASDLNIAAALAGGYIGFKTVTSGTTSQVERVRIDSNGRVGIGDTSPDTALHVKSADNILATFESTDADALIEFKDNGTSDSILVGAIGGDDLLLRCDAGNLIFNLGNNSEKARFDSSGRLLIGTTTEGHSSADDLTIAGSGQTGLTIRSGTSNDGAIFFADGTSGNAEYRGFVQYNQPNDNLNFGTSGLSRLTLDSSGHLLPNADSTHNIGSNSVRFANGYFDTLYGDGSNLTGISSSSDSISEGNSTFEVLDTGTNGIARFLPEGSEVFRITHEGHVGIGTTNPQRQLHIVGNDGATGATPGNSDTCLVLDNQQTNGAIIEFLGDNNGAGRIMFTDTDASNQGQINYTHSNDLMLIQSAGSIHLKPAGGENGIVIQANGTVSLYHDNGLKFQTASNRTFHYVSCNPANSGNMDLGSTSERWRTVYATNAFNTSDRTLKEDIVTCDLGLDFIKKLKPISYKWIQKEDENLDSKTHYGFVAQDVEETLTELGKTLNDFGGVSKEDDGAMGLAYTEIVSPLVKAVQELTTEIETLKTKVAALEAA